MFDPNKTHVTKVNGVVVGIRIQLTGEWWMYYLNSKSFTRTVQPNKYNTVKVFHFENIEAVKNKVDNDTYEQLRVGMIHAFYKNKKAA